jgi:DedD protein
MADSSDANLQLKKRARRRLVGAIAFAGLAAVVLPMVMDEEPKQQVQDVQIRIPGQDQTPFNPKVVKPVAPTASSEKTPAPEPAEVVPAPLSKTPEKPPEKAQAKVTEKAEKTAEKPGKSVDAKAGVSEPQRAAAILDGKVPAAATGNGQYLILIGAFSNPANVKQLQAKIGELGIKVFTEPLDTPEGKKTRVRAGPFPNREAADKALDRIKRIGVNGVVAAKQ